jgi:hypothetical protein
VRGFGQHEELGAGDPLGHPLGPGGGGEVIALGSDHERRRLDVAELSLGGIVEGAAERPHAAPGAGVDEVVQDRRCEPRGGVPGVARPAHRQPGRCVRLRVEGGPHEDQALDGGRVAGGEIDRDLAAEGDPDHDRGRQLVVEQPVAQGVRQARHVERVDRLIAHAEAGQIGSEDRPASAERPDQGLERAARGEAVDQDDRRRLELRGGAVPVGGSFLELARHADEDAIPARMRPTPVYAVAARSNCHPRANIPANCG